MIKQRISRLAAIAIATIITFGLAPQALAGTKVCTNCVTFSAEEPFGIFLQSGVRGQNLSPVVTLEWSTNQVDWSEYKQQDANDFATFTGYQAGLDASDGLYKLHIRGTNNTQFASAPNSGRNSNRFTNTVNSVARKIACTGNAETLLDWKKVAKGEHPKMGNYAFCYMFTFMQTLTTAPDLPAINLSTNCYYQMFWRCSSLTKAPAVLPATTLEQGCYQQMFKECTSLTKAPKIAAMNQGQNACNGMFNEASALKVPPKLLATNIVKNCYQSMLQKTAIELNTTGPGKPWMIPEAAAESAATANNWCLRMFSNTTSEVSLQSTIEAGKQYYIASATPVTLTVPAVEGASKVTVVDDGDEVSGSSPYTVYENDDVSVTYTADDGYMFPGGKTEFTTNFTATADPMVLTPPTPISKYTCQRTELKDGESTNLVAGTYTAAPTTTADGGVFYIDAGATLAGTNVTFAGNSARSGGAIFNHGGVVTLTHATFKDNEAEADWEGGAINNNVSGVLNLNDVAFENNTPASWGGAISNWETANLLGPVSLVTANDTLFNLGLLNWNLTGETTGVLNGYQNLINENENGTGTLQITVDDGTVAASPITIATGDFSNIAGKDTFTITNALGGAAATIQIGGITAAGGCLYKLEIAEAPEAEPPTTNLVLTVVKLDMSHVIVNSNWAGKYKLGEEIEIEGKTYYYGVNAVAEMLAVGLLMGTETLEIAGGSAAITNAVALKEGAQLILKDGAALSIMGADAALTGLADTGSISGSGAIYLKKSNETTELDYYKNKLAPGSNVLVARASVTDQDASMVEDTKCVQTDLQNPSADTNAVITANLTADGSVSGLCLNVWDEKDLIAAGSITATPSASRILQLYRKKGANTGDLTVHGKVSGFDTIEVYNKSATGKMTTTSMLAANKNITISNKGHLEAKVIAGGNIDINNTSPNTIIGEYSGQYVSITNTAKGVAQDITLQAYGRGENAGMISLIGETGSIYSNVTLVAGKNATPSDISANDGKGTVRVYGANTLSGAVLMRGDQVSLGSGGLLRLENADVTCSVSQVLVDTEISGECNIVSNDNGVATFVDALTLKDGAVLGGKTRIRNEWFTIEGTATLKDGAEVYCEAQPFIISSGKTLKLRGSKIVSSISNDGGTLDVCAGRNYLTLIGNVSTGTLNLKGGELITLELQNAGVINWDLTEGTTTLDWSKVNDLGGTLMATVGDVASGTSYLLATNATSFAQTITVTYSGAGGAAATVKAGGVCKVAGQFWALSVLNGELRLAAFDPVKLTDVFLIDEEGKTNATAVVKIGGQTVEPEADGSFEVPANYPLDVVYRATDDYMFGPGWKEKTVSLPEGTTGGAMPEEYKEKAEASCQSRWADEREIALDTRERIVVASPNEVLPLAYSTNNWGEVENGWKVSLSVTPRGGVEQQLVSTNVNGYAEWMPTVGAFGSYNVGCMTERTMDFPVTTNVTVWYGQDYQFVFDEDQMIYVQRPGDEYGLGNLEDVTSYTLLNLKATPEYTNVDRYEFVSWKAYSYAERDIGWKTPDECPKLAACFGDITAAETTFEMPFTNVFLTCSYQWKSNYNEVVSVEPGIYNAWEIHEGEKYAKGIATTNGSIVSFREDIRTCFTGDSSVLNLAAGATNIWDFTKNGRPCLSYFSRVVSEEGAVNMVLFDETLTNASYRIAVNAQSAVGTAFLISDGSSAKECMVVAQASLETSDWTYIGAKRFKLYVMTNNELRLIVDFGKFAITYDAMAGKWTDGSETNVVDAYVNKGYEFPTEPKRDNYTFVGWFRSWGNNVQIVETNVLVSPVQPLESHSLYAHWTPISTEPTSKDIAIPDVTNGAPVLVIGEFEYAQSSHPSQKFESLVTPLYLQTIGKGAFQGVTTLKTLIITPSRSYDDPHIAVPLTIGVQAFASCAGLEEIRIPDTVSKLGVAAFMNCAKLKRIIFTGVNTIECDTKALYRCGYDNGAGELKVYMKKEFCDNNVALTNLLATWNTTLKVVPLVGKSPASGESLQIKQTDFGSLGSDRKVALLVKVPTLIPGTMPDVSAVVIKHSTDLSNWSNITPEYSEAAEDGTVLIEFTMPEGNICFMKVEVTE